MTELFLDGMPAAFMPSANFKLTAENFYFTKSSSYTFDVELPLGVEQNRRIFGNIDRIDVSKSTRTLTARLVVDNETLLVGTAKLTSDSESSVKVQLLGKEAAYNYGNKVEGLYIDQMDLGDWYHETWPDGSYYGVEHINGERVLKWLYSTDGEVPMGIFERALLRGPEFGDETLAENELFLRFLGVEGGLGWVAYPTYAENRQTRFNQVAYYTLDVNAESPEFSAFIKDYERSINQPQEGWDDMTYAFAVQPMMWKVAEIIAKHTGFTLAREDNALYTDELFSRIFLVSCSTSVKCNKCLPHWTVNEFWEQVENTFGLVMSLDYINGTMRLQRRKDFYTSAPQVVLSDIVDEFETTLEDETKHDISVSSVGFADFDCNPEDVLDERILRFAEYMDFETFNDLKEWAKQVQSSGSLSNYKNTIFRCADGHQFIYSLDALGADQHSFSGDGKRGFAEVNMLRPRINKPVAAEAGSADNNKEDEHSVDIELKIVPARYSLQKADVLTKLCFAGWPGTDAVKYRKEELLCTFDVRMLQVPGPEMPIETEQPANIHRGEKAVIDLEAIIAGQDDFESPDDSETNLIYIAITNPTEWQNHVFNFENKKGPHGHATQYPRARLRDRCFLHLDWNDPSYDDVVMYDHYSLSLVPIDGQYNLAHATVKDLTVIHTDVRHCFKFIADKMPDTGAVFNIRNRLFVCEKIEANIKPEGLDHLMTGYFYELKN